MQQQFIGLSLSCAGMVLTGSPAASAEPERPSFLLSISDDQSWCHTGAAGDPVVRTPTFDRVAKNGVNFLQAYCSAPSCAPSRAAILTGQDFYRLEEAANLLSEVPKKFKTYTDILMAEGYAVGFCRKGWAPGQVTVSGREYNPAGPEYKSFDEFLRTVKEGQPFCFWFGSRDPHRPYDSGTGRAAGLDASKVPLPDFFPETPEIRNDMLDYYYEIERYDRETGNMIALLEKTGRLENTMIVMTSDNGMPFPRGKATLYDFGVRMPLAIQWKRGAPHGDRTIQDFVNLTDLMPTFLEAAGIDIPTGVTGRSLLPLLQTSLEGHIDPSRDQVVFGRERHDRFRKPTGEPIGYPSRGIRTERFLYVRNYRPDRIPAQSDIPCSDVDDSPTKTFFDTHREQYSALYDLAFGPRPSEELYDCEKDPDQIHNQVENPDYAFVLSSLRSRLEEHLKVTGDPRGLGDTDIFDRYPVLMHDPTHLMAPNRKPLW